MENQKSQPRLASPKEAAKILGYSEEHIQCLLRNGQLPGRKFGGLWRVDLIQIEEKLRGTNSK